MLAALVWRLLAARAAVNRYPDDADIYEEDVLPVRRTQKDPALLSQVTCCYSIVLNAIATTAAVAAALFWCSTADCPHCLSVGSTAAIAL
jgi:hypothetical protein